MPSRRRLLSALGPAALGLVAGCAAAETTTGTVSRKRVTVAVPRQVGDAVEASVALLAFEPDRGLVHGEYDPEHAGAAVAEGTLAVSASLHERLADRFAAVRYGVDVVPGDGGTPANGLVTRGAFDRLPLGGTATVETHTGDDGSGRLRVQTVAPPERAPSAVTVSQFDLDERVDDG